MTTLLPYQTTELSDEIDPCEKSRLGSVHLLYRPSIYNCVLAW